MWYKCFVWSSYNQNIKHRFFLVVFFCSPIILPLAIISNMTASSRKIVTIFQLHLALHSMCVDRQVFFTNCAISFLLLDEDWLSIVCAAAKAVAAAAAPKITLWCIYKLFFISNYIQAHDLCKKIFILISKVCSYLLYF